MTIAIGVLLILLAAEHGFVSVIAIQDSQAG